MKTTLCEAANYFLPEVNTVDDVEEVVTDMIGSDELDVEVTDGDSELDVEADIDDEETLDDVEGEDDMLDVISVDKAKEAMEKILAGEFDNVEDALASVIDDESEELEDELDIDDDMDGDDLEESHSTFIKYSARYLKDM